MTVTVTRKPGGITQLFNTETGRVTYKCRAESAFMLMEAFGGIVKFNQNLFKFRIITTQKLKKPGFHIFHL